MKTILIILISIIVFISCEDIKIPMPVTTFDAPFPKRNVNLSNVLGDQLTIKSDADTISYAIYSDKKYNLIVNRETADTVFFGLVSRYRGVYYFNQQLNDSSYWIYAVKITDNLIYGLNTQWHQLMQVDEKIKKGNNKKLIKYINSDTTLIRLHPEKREMKKLFSSILIKSPPDTILNITATFLAMTDTTSAVTSLDPEDFDLIYNVYPNPANGIINIELQQRENITFRLSDLNGRTIMSGKLNELFNQIDISKKETGMYALTIINAAENQKETIKVIKTK